MELLPEQSRLAVGLELQYCAGKLRTNPPERLEAFSCIISRLFGLGSLSALRRWSVRTIPLAQDC